MLHQHQILNWKVSQEGWTKGLLKELVILVIDGQRGLVRTSCHILSTSGCSLLCIVKSKSSTLDMTNLLFLSQHRHETATEYFLNCCCTTTEIKPFNLPYSGHAPQKMFLSLWVHRKSVWSSIMKHHMQVFGLLYYLPNQAAHFKNHQGLSHTQAHLL